MAGQCTIVRFGRHSCYATPTQRERERGWDRIECVYRHIWAASPRLVRQHNILHRLMVSEVLHEELYVRAFGLSISGLSPARPAPAFDDGQDGRCWRLSQADCPFPPPTRGIRNGRRAVKFCHPLARACSSVASRSLPPPRSRQRASRETPNCSFGTAPSLAP